MTPTLNDDDRCHPPPVFEDVDRLREVGGELVRVVEAAQDLAFAWTCHYQTLHELEEPHEEHAKILSDVTAALVKAREAGL